MCFLSGMLLETKNKVALLCIVWYGMVWYGHGHGHGHGHGMVWYGMVWSWYGMV